MKTLVLVVLLLTNAVTFADVHVNGYTRQDGTYVAPHYRSNPDGDRSNNWSERGNTNPYTGEEGHKN